MGTGIRQPRSVIVSNMSPGKQADNSHSGGHPGFNSCGAVFDHHRMRWFDVHLLCRIQKKVGMGLPSLNMLCRTEDIRSEIIGQFELAQARRKPFRCAGRRDTSPLIAHIFHGVGSASNGLQFSCETFANGCFSLGSEAFGKWITNHRFDRASAIDLALSHIERRCVIDRSGMPKGGDCFSQHRVRDDFSISYYTIKIKN